jgi:hypothetical protein
MHSDFNTNIKSHLFVGVVLAVLAFAGRIEVIGIATIALYWISIRGFAISKKSLFKAAFLLMIVFITLGLSFHKLPGFHNILYLENYASGAGASLENRYINFDKGFLMLFLLDYYIQNKQSGKLMPAISYSVFLSVITIAILAAIAMSQGYIKFSPKVPPMILSWTLLNLAVVLAEESFFRAFLQRIINSYLSKSLGKNSAIASVLTVSIIFAVGHHAGGTMLMLLCFVASFFYGYAFVKTKRIEASIMVHFLVNLLHIFFFTHPYAV